MVGARDRGGHLWDKDREAVSDDGTTIRYTVRGPDDAPPVVLCAGYLCPDNFWWHLAPELARTRRVVLLNYRGVGASDHPTEPGFLGRNLRAMDYSMANLAADVRAVMDTEAIEAAPLVGHSMGCQVALELYRSDPERVVALLLVTGPYTSPLESFYDSEVGARIFPLVYRLGKVVPEPLLRLVPKLGYLPGVLEVAQLVRAIGPATPRAPMQRYVDHFTRIDAGVALRVAQAMHRHDASALLDDIDVPTLIVVGERDTFSPPRLGHQMLERIPDSELVSLPDATHCALLEFPEMVNDAVLGFLERRVDRTGATLGDGAPQTGERHGTGAT